MAVTNTVEQDVDSTMPIVFNTQVARSNIGYEVGTGIFTLISPGVYEISYGASCLGASGPPSPSTNEPQTDDPVIAVAINGVEQMASRIDVNFAPDDSPVLWASATYIFVIGEASPSEPATVAIIASEICPGVAILDATGGSAACAFVSINKID